MTEHELPDGIPPFDDDGIIFDAPWIATGETPNGWLCRTFNRHYSRALDEILASASRNIDGATADQGVYFLIADGEVVYVGQAICIGQRLEQHRKDKKFDSYACVARVPKSFLDAVESFYISTLRPRLNMRAAPRIGVLSKFLSP